MLAMGGVGQDVTVNGTLKEVLEILTAKGVPKGESERTPSHTPEPHLTLP